MSRPAAPPTGPRPLLGRLGPPPGPYGPEEPRSNQPAPGYVSVAQASRRLGVTQQAVRRLVAHGELSGVSVRGRAVWVLLADVDARLRRAPEA